MQIEFESVDWMNSINTIIEECLEITIFFFFLFFFLFCLFVCLFFRDRVSLDSSGCPGTHFVEQAGLEVRNPPASASHVLGLKACATTARLILFFLPNDFIDTL